MQRKEHPPRHLKTPQARWGERSKKLTWGGLTTVQRGFGKGMDKEKGRGVGRDRIPVEEESGTCP